MSNTLAEGDSLDAGSLDAWHRVANFSFLPFVTNLLRDRPTSRAKAAIPVDRPELLTAECVEAVGDILPQAVLRTFGREVGWQQTCWAVEGDDQYRQCRMWDEAVCPQLRFTQESLESLLIIHALSAVSDAADGVTLVNRLRTMSLEANGDLLIQYLAVRPLVFHPSIGPALRRLDSNPLVCLALPVEWQPPLDIQRLMGDDLQTWLPWILAHVAAQWRQHDPWIWDRPWKSWTACCAARQAAAEAWLSVGWQRADLLVPLVRHAAQLLRHPAGGLADASRFRSLTSSHSLGERRAAAATWLNAIEFPFALARHEEHVRGVHPVDRDACQRLFLSACQAARLDDVCQRLAALRQQWLPTL